MILTNEVAGFIGRHIDCLTPRHSSFGIYWNTKKLFLWFYIFWVFDVRAQSYSTFFNFFSIGTHYKIHYNISQSAVAFKMLPQCQCKYVIRDDMHTANASLWHWCSCPQLYAAKAALVNTYRVIRKWQIWDFWWRHQKSQFAPFSIYCKKNRNLSFLKKIPSICLIPNYCMCYFLKNHFPTPFNK